MLVQAGALALLVAGGGAFAPALGAAVLLGVGTALVYPTLIAAVSDVVQPVDRAQLVGVYRFWRDFGFVVGALLAGLVADAAGAGAAIAVVAALTAASGLWVAMTRWGRDRSADRRAARRNVDELLADARRTHRSATRTRTGARGCRTGRCSSTFAPTTSGGAAGSFRARSTSRARCSSGVSTPTASYCNPAACDLDREVILMCADGFSSSFAAASLRELGCRTPTDLVGGFAAMEGCRASCSRPGEDDEWMRANCPGWARPARLKTKGGAMAVEVDIDVEVLKCEIKKTYARVSEEPDKDFIFPTGRAWALDLGYPPDSCPPA